MPLLKFFLSDQPSTSILVDVTETKPMGGLVRASRADGQAKDASETLEAVLHKSMPLFIPLGNYLQDIRKAGMQATLEIGLRLTDECDIILTSPSSEQATLKLTLQPAKDGN